MNGSGVSGRVLDYLSFTKKVVYIGSGIKSQAQGVKGSILSQIGVRDRDMSIARGRSNAAIIFLNHGLG